MKKKPTKLEDVVLVTKGEHCTFLTFWCEHCEEPHTIPVRTLGEIITRLFGDKYKGTIFLWNGSTTRPSLELGRTCVAHSECHAFISKGRISYWPDWPYTSNPMLPLKEWPFKQLPPPDSSEAKAIARRRKYRKMFRDELGYGES